MSYSRGVVNSLHTSSHAVTFSDERQTAVDVVLQNNLQNLQTSICITEQNAPRFFGRWGAALNLQNQKTTDLGTSAVANNDTV